MLDIKRLNNKLRHIQEENCVTDGLLQTLLTRKGHCADFMQQHLHSPHSGPGYQQPFLTSVL